MLAIKITHTALAPTPYPLLLLLVNSANRWTVDCGSSSCGLSCQLCRHLAVVETKSKCKSFIFAAFHVVHWQLTPYLPPPLTRSLTWRHIGRYKRQDIHFILTIAALYCCGRLGQDLVHLIGGSGGEGSSHCQQQQTIENPNRNQIVGFVAFANHREALRVACNLKCKSGLNCVTVRARLGDDSMRIDYTTKD